MSVPTVPASIGWAHPIVAEWFVRKFGTPTEPQEQGWPPILAGRTTLISAPTGSGKTLAAFLACIDRLVRKALAGELVDRTEVLYVSPLKALGNDIQKNLEGPLGEILALAAERGLLMPEIRTAVRTGDTLAKDRRLMLKRPPHILVTTPESLYILLTADKSRAILRDVETVIVDEIHAVADDKRGAHLALSLERLEALVQAGSSTTPDGSRLANHPASVGMTRLPLEMGAPGLVRIGLSATQKPIELVAQFLTGGGRPDPVIVNVGHRRKMDLAVEVPPMPLGPVASNEMWDEIYDRLVALGAEHRSTLVFVNTRRMVERVSHNLGERMGDENVAAHHGSLSRKLRLEAERKLKEGEVKILVATASLELGIDVGTVDLVVQINSPRAIAAGLQRVGRAGHWRGAIPKGRFFATTRDDLVECAALVRAIQSGDLDRLMIPDAPMDILAQQIVAACSAEEWDEEEMFALVRRAYPYRDLEREKFDAVLEMLSEGIASRRGRYGAYVHRDRVNGKLRARRGARLAAITSGGAIPDNALYTVIAEPDGAMVGTVDEDFAVESSRGDVMLLGNTSWVIRRVETKAGRMMVEDAHGAPPSVPFWRGEAPARTEELSTHVGELRREISARLPHTSPVAFSTTQPDVAAAVAWIKPECGLDDSGAEQVLEYILQGRAVLGDVPARQTVIAERFFDEGGGMQLVIHAPFGGRINKAWGLALRKRFCVGFNFELQAAATDNGLNIALAEQHSFPLGDVFRFLQADTVQPILEQAALDSPIFATRWRWDANRALALLRFQNGKKVPPQIQRMRSDDLLASVFPDAAACFENIEDERKIPDHPLVNEVMKDVLHEAMDVEGLKAVLRGMADGSIRCIAVDTPVPSQFSHEILNANPYAYLDDAPLEERRARAVEMRRVLPASVLEEVGGLEPAAIEQVQQEAWPDVRDADELHDVLHTMVGLPDIESRAGLDLADGGVRAYASRDGWRGYFDRLVGEGRAGRAEWGGKFFWVAAERAKSFAAVFPGVEFLDALAEVEKVSPARDEALLTMVTGWMTHLGPVTAGELGGMLGLSAAEIEGALLRMEASGTILRGKFSSGKISETEWCERRLLARIHRLTVATLRKQVEPVTRAQFMRWLMRWQHVAPETQVAGERGVLEVLRQLQGFEIPANAWERQILRRRVADYDPKWLDQLCLTGAVGWGRLSPHPAMVDARVVGAEVRAIVGNRKESVELRSTRQPLRLRSGQAWAAVPPQTIISTQTILSTPASPAEAVSAPRQRRVIPTSVAPITFFVREDVDWMAPRDVAAEESRGLGEGARQVLEYLKLRGASFFADIVRGVGKLKAEIETALWELVAAGLVTADGFDNLRALIDPKRRAGQGSGKVARPRHSAGRWALLHAGDEVDRARRVEAACWMLMRRYGIVVRDLLSREANLPAWREMLTTFRRMEDRGEIRGGRFVDGFLGEQFALPVAVESLRALRREENRGEEITLSAADPLNLVGILVPGERVPAISGRTVVYRDGVAVGEAAVSDQVAAVGESGAERMQA